MKLIADMDGNALCVKREDFINLAESPAFFITLNPKQINEVNSLLSTKARKEDE